MPTAVPASTGGIGTNPLVVYNWEPSVQLGGFIAAETTLALGGGADPEILFLGDSVTVGDFGNPGGGDYRQAFSYPAEMTAYLGQDGLPTQMDNWFSTGGASYLNIESADSRLSLIGNAVWGAVDLGGATAQTAGPGDGVQFTPTSPGVYNELALYDLSNAGTLEVAATLTNGAVYETDVVGTYMGGAAQNTTTDIALPLGTYASVSVTQVGTYSNALYIEGTSFSNTVTPETQVFNGAQDGQDSSIGGYPIAGYPGSNNELSGAYHFVAQDGSPENTAVFIDYGTNDFLDGNITPQQTVLNVGSMVADFQSLGAEPTIVIPTPPAGQIPGQAPVNMTAWLNWLSVVRPGLEALAIADNVPIIDLSATWDDGLSNSGSLYANGVHLSGEGYSDIGEQLAQTLATAIYTSEMTAVYQQELDRPPDPGGLSYWVSQLFAGVALQTIVADGAQSQEAQSDITDLYETVLGRAPDPGGFASKQAELAGGESLTAVRTEMAFSGEEAADLNGAFDSAYGAAATPSSNQIAAFEALLATPTGAGASGGASQAGVIAEINAEALGTSTSPTFIYVTSSGTVTSSGAGDTFDVVSAASEVIQGFNPAADTLQVTSSLSLGALLAGATQTAAGVVIHLQQGSVTLSGVSLGALSQQNVAII